MEFYPTINKAVKFAKQAFWLIPQSQYLEG
jgi:hypothetical protein